MQSLVDVVVKNAGAEKVVLFTKNENGWFITAQGTSADENVTFMKIPLEEASSKVPLKVIGEVIQHRKEIVIKNATTDSKYMQDKYVTEHKCHSMLCLPLIYQKKMRAILYLENSLTEGAFTEERLQNVLLLSSHIANALENAFLYEELKTYSKDLEVKVQERTKEIAEKNVALVSTLEELKKTQNQLIASEKLASLGELTTGIAHEIRNPLNFINNFSTLNINLTEKNRQLFQQLTEEKQESNRKEITDQVYENLDKLKDNGSRILSYGKRMAEIITLMEKHSRIGQGGLQPTSISVLIDLALANVKADFALKYPDFSPSIDNHYDESIGHISLVPDEMHFVLSNVIKNAMEAMAEKWESEKDYQPYLFIQAEKTSDMVGITIKDNGIGIEEELLDKVFNPFYTSKPTGQAIGLALSISHMIVTSIHHGYMTIASQPDLFTEVTITLPVRNQE